MLQTKIVPEVLKNIKDNYFTIHQHSIYSVRDGNMSIKQIVAKHKELGYKYCLITDHGSLSSVYELFTECEKNGIIPVIGQEFYMNYLNPENPAKGHHITTIVLNETGWKNMLKLQWLSMNKENVQLDGFTGAYNYKPRVTNEMLWHYQEGLAITTGCRLSTFNYYFMNNQDDLAINEIIKYKHNVDNFFIELHIANNEVEEELYHKLKSVALEEGIPTLVANDTHYLSKGDLITWNLLSANRSGGNIFNQDDFIKNDDFYIKTPEEVIEDVIRIEEKKELKLTDFTHSSFTQRVNSSFAGIHKLIPLLQFKWENRKMPELKFPEAEEDLKQYLWKALIQKFKGVNNIPSIYIERLKKEWEISKLTNNVSYFYLIKNFLQRCKDEGIMMSNGRGSASSLLICMLIGASRVDPLKYNLIIERAMNVDRPKLMDVDLDFCKSEGAKVHNILVDMFGSDKVCNIVNFGYCGVKQSFQTVARFLKIPPAQADMITKELSQFEEKDEDGNTHVSRANQEQQMKLLENHSFIKEFELNVNGIMYTGKDVIDLCYRMWNTINNLSIHASGVLIMNEAIYNYIPVVRVNDTICSAFDMEVLEKLNGLKLDVLKIKTNDLIKNCLNIYLEQGVNKLP